LQDLVASSLQAVVIKTTGIIKVSAVVKVTTVTIAIVIEAKVKNSIEFITTID